MRITRSFRVRKDETGVSAEKKLPFEFVLDGLVTEFEHFL
jgi:hypothetical protein